MNYITPDPEQKIIELEESVTQNDQHLQKVEAENIKLKTEIERLKSLLEEIRETARYGNET